MNPFKSIRSIGLAISLAALAVVVVAPHAEAQPSTYDFKITNAVTGATVYGGLATNVVGSNGCATGSGTFLSVPNADKGMLSFTGANSATNVGNFVFTLLLSSKTSPPNAATDFETTAATSRTFTITMNGTNVVTWCTNIDTYNLGAASYIGIGSVSNTASAGFVTNSLSTNYQPMLKFTPKINTFTGLKSPG